MHYLPKLFQKCEISTEMNRTGLKCKGFTCTNVCAPWNSWFETEGAGHSENLRGRREKYYFVACLDSLLEAITKRQTSWRSGDENGQDGGRR